MVQAERTSDLLRRDRSPHHAEDGLFGDVEPSTQTVDQRGRIIGSRETPAAAWRMRAHRSGPLDAFHRRLSTRHGIEDIDVRLGSQQLAQAEPDRGMVVAHPIPGHAGGRPSCIGAD